MITLFVYGSLKKGFYNHRLLKESTFIGSGIISGYDLYDLGYYQGIKRGSGEVLGEIYEIDQETLKRVDVLESEGYLYRRVPVEAKIEGDTVKAVTYVYNKSIDSSRRIEREWRDSYD